MTMRMRTNVYCVPRVRSTAICIRVMFEAFLADRPMSPVVPGRRAALSVDRSGRKMHMLLNYLYVVYGSIRQADQ